MSTAGNRTQPRTTESTREGTKNNLYNEQPVHPADEPREARQQAGNQHPRNKKQEPESITEQTNQPIEAEW